MLHPEQARQRLALAVIQAGQQRALAAQQVLEGGVDPVLAQVGEGDEDAAPVAGVWFAPHQARLGEAVDAVGHGA